MAGGREGPEEGDWEERPGLDKVLAERTGICQGGTRPARQKRRLSLGAR